MSYVAQLQSINDHLRTQSFWTNYGSSMTASSATTTMFAKSPYNYGSIGSSHPGETMKITATQVAVVRGNGAVEVFDSVAEAERKAALWAANDRDECLILKPVKRIASKPVDVETTDLP